MRIRYNGEDAVDIPGANYVEQGDVVEVSDEVGASLLLAGCSIDDDGNVTPAEDPLWSDADGQPLSPTGEDKFAAAVVEKPLTRAEKKAAAAAAAAAAAEAALTDSSAGEPATSDEEPK